MFMHCKSNTMKDGSGSICNPLNSSIDIKNKIQDKVSLTSTIHSDPKSLPTVKIKISVKHSNCTTF
jgi:hypothetical protein